MPLFEFICKKCHHQYDEMCSFDKTGKYKGVKCPECQSSSKEKLISATSFNFDNPIGTDRWTSDGTGHDYRFNWNLPNVRKQREAAESKSHMGKTPYKEIDDISSGKHFGPVQ